MPDWTQLVRDRLATLNLPAGVKEDVLAELAAHLQETFESACAAGLTESDGIKQSMQEVGDWRVLASEINRTKSEPIMNNRTRALWIPAAINLIAASALLAAMQFLGLRPRLIWLHSPGQPFALMFYVPWLASLPLFGALGAGLARRARAATSSRLAAGLSPALAFFGLMLLALPVDLIVGTGFDRWKMIVVGSWLLTWGLLPAVALLAGALPFLRPETGHGNKAAA